VPGYDHSVPPGQSPTASYGTGRHLRTIQSTPRMRGAIRTWRSTPSLQYSITPVLQRSITPRARIRERSAEAPCAVDAPARPRDGGANQALPPSMIRIELPTLIFIYLYLAVIVIGGLWFLDSWRSRKRKKQALRYTVRCTICASIFEDKTNELLPRCPRCGCMNERRNFGGL
jgi:hypothetical protein